jgi:hypothetical protein
MQVRINTTDATWVQRNALIWTTDEFGNHVATIEISDVERLTFGPKNAPMIRFDLSKVAKRLPRDWYNANAMIPASHIVSV